MRLASSENLHADLGVARGLRVLREQGQAGRRWIAQEQEVDDRRVDRAPARCREAGGCELADLVVRERIVGGGALVVLDEQARGHGRRERCRQFLEAHLLLVHAEPDLAQVLEAEVASEHGRLGERGLGVLGEVGGAARDQRSDRRGDEAFGVAGKRPDAVDLLDHPAVAVGVRHLLDDERDALGLPVHRGGARRAHGPAEELLQERLGFGLAEAVEAQMADQPHPLHVRDQVDGLGHERELLGPDREQQEDRTRRVGADDVAEQPQAVVVGPLEVVDEQRDRPDRREVAHRDGAEIQRPQELAVRRQAREARVVLPGHGVHAAPERLLGGRARGPPPSPRRTRRSSARPGTARGAPRHPSPRSS